MDFFRRFLPIFQNANSNEKMQDASATYAQHATILIAAANTNPIANNEQKTIIKPPIHMNSNTIEDTATKYMPKAVIESKLDKKQNSNKAEQKNSIVLSDLPKNYNTNKVAENITSNLYNLLSSTYANLESNKNSDIKTEIQENDKNRDLDSNPLPVIDSIDSEMFDNMLDIIAKDNNTVQDKNCKLIPDDDDDVIFLSSSSDCEIVEPLCNCNKTAKNISDISNDKIATNDKEHSPNTPKHIIYCNNYDFSENNTPRKDPTKEIKDDYNFDDFVAQFDGNIDADVIDLDAFNNILENDNTNMENNSEINNEDLENIIPGHKIENINNFSDKTEIDFKQNICDVKEIVTDSQQDETVDHSLDNSIQNVVTGNIEHNKVYPNSNEETNNKEPTQSSDDDGYNSSDFEFITEIEAKKHGFIIHFNLDEEIFNIPHEKTSKSEDFKNKIDPGEGPSGLRRQNRSYREHHVMPNEDGYLNLFQGRHFPSIPDFDTFFMENKSIRTSVMNWRFDGIGFEKQMAMMRRDPDSSEEEFTDDAKETVQKILSMYPKNNRKRRRNARR